MGWLWSGRGKPRSRPRVARAIGLAHDALAGVATDLGGATAVMERALWSHDLPTLSPARAADGGWDAPRGGWDAPRGDWDEMDGDWDEMGGGMDAYAELGVSLAGAAPARRRDFGNVGILLERAEDTARKLGRSRAEMWEEALRAWLDSQMADALAGGEAAPEEDETLRPAPRPWLFEARRQRVWGEIDETLGALRTA